MALSINNRYLNDELQKSWTDGTKIIDHDDDTKLAAPILFNDPFRCFALPNFVDFSNYQAANDQSSSGSSSCVPKYEKSYLNLLLEELELLELHEKKNDLYNFRQSDDLHNVNTPAINAFKRFFNDQVKTWLQQLTGIELNDRVAMTASAYAYGDYLLCHDDELEHRRVAYTFYLTPNWTAEDGGRLDLFSSDDKLRPLEIVNSIVPFENMLAFFEVVPKSFHQVSEVTNKGKVRWSINGWFHGSTIERPKLVVDSIPSRIQPSFIEFDDLLSWINLDYFEEETQANIREQFEEKSEIQLRHFLQVERYEAIMSELQKSDLNWKHKGPWNRRNYLSVDDSINLDAQQFPNLSFCIRLMQSEAIYILLSQFTNMVLHPLYQEDGLESGNGDVASEDYCPPTKKRAPSNENDETAGASTSANDGALASVEDENKDVSPCELELRKFEPGSYTVLSDADFMLRASNGEAFALDAQLYFTSCEWDTKHGGYTCYVEKDSSEELLTVLPCGNSLTLVCSESGTQKFVKYINRNAIDDFGDTSSSSPSFVDISATYYEAKNCEEVSKDGNEKSSERH